MNLRLTRHLFTRLMRSRRLVGMLALASVAGLIAWVSALGEEPETAAATYRVIVATVPAATLSIAMLFLATATLRDERDGGTLPYIFVTPIPRFVFAFSSWLAATGACVLVAVFGWFVGWMGLGLATGNWGAGTSSIVVYVAAAVGYSAVFLPLGYLFSRSLIVGLGYVFVWEGILAAFVPGIGPSSVWRVALSMWADVTELPRDAMDVLGSVKPGAGGAGLTLLVLFAISTGVLASALRTRDAV